MPTVVRLMVLLLLLFGLHKGFKHDIKVVVDSVIRSKQYPLRPQAREEIQKWLRKMIANGFVQRVNSPYRSPLLVVAKKTSGGYSTV